MAIIINENLTLIKHTLYSKLLTVLCSYFKYFCQITLTKKIETLHSICTSLYSQQQWWIVSLPPFSHPYEFVALILPLKKIKSSLMCDVQVFLYMWSFIGAWFTYLGLTLRKD